MIEKKELNNLIVQQMKKRRETNLPKDANILNTMRQLKVLVEIHEKDGNSVDEAVMTELIQRLKKTYSEQALFYQKLSNGKEMYNEYADGLEWIESLIPTVGQEEIESVLNDVISSLPELHIKHMKSVIGEVKARLPLAENGVIATLYKSKLS